MTNFTIKDSKTTFDEWVNKDYIPDNLKESLSNAAILIIPSENLRDYDKPLFPTSTDEIFRYFKKNLPQDLTIDICISDEDFVEYAFNSNYKRLGLFLVKSAAIPVFVALFSAYIYDTYIKDDESKPQTTVIDNSKNVTIINNGTLTDKKYMEPTNIMFSVTLIDSVGNSKEINYEGPAKEVDVVLKALKDYEE